MNVIRKCHKNFQSVDLQSIATRNDYEIVTKFAKDSAEIYKKRKQTDN